MGTDNGGSIQYGYTFEILNTFKMGHLKKSCSHIPSRMDPSQTPGMLTHHYFAVLIISNGNHIRITFTEASRNLPVSAAVCREFYWIYLH